MSLNSSIAPYLQFLVIANPPAGHVGRVLSGPLPASWGALPPPPTNIIKASEVNDFFIRPCYDRVFRQILHSVMPNPNSALKGVLITGNPGIGNNHENYSFKRYRIHYLL
jgi:hypothetical protein